MDARLAEMMKKMAYMLTWALKKGGHSVDAAQMVKRR
jgi:hypothetical protein